MTRETIISLLSVHAEYVFIDEYRCQRCGSGVNGERCGSRPGVKGCMEDVWELTCKTCGRSETIVLSVPSLTSFPKEEWAAKFEEALRWFKQSGHK